jgi:hypothetical protein
MFGRACYDIDSRQLKALTVKKNQAGHPAFVRTLPCDDFLKYFFS